MAEPRDRYSAVSLFLHWTIAALLIGQILLISVAEEASGSERGFWMMLHKSGGATILVLTLVRLLWRIRNPAIPLPMTMPRWQKVFARTTHVLFYVALIVMPLTGWMAGSAAGRGFEYYGVFDFPLLPVSGGRDTARALMDIHELVVKGLYVLIALHLAGALKHHFINRDNVLRRMLPFLPERAR